MESRGHLMSLFMLAVTLPVSAMAMIVLVPRLAETDAGRVALLLLVTPLSLMLCIPTIKLLVLPGVRLARIAWLKRHASEAEYGVTPPLCRACGYDLRASPDKCPECGTPVNRIDGTIIRYLMTLRRRDQLDQQMLHK